MRIFIAFILMICVSAASLKSIAQTNLNTDIYKKIETVNAEITEAFMNKNISKLMQYYVDDAICMPEYHKALYKKGDIENYFQQWFNSVTIKDYQHTIYEVKSIKGYLIEIGTFTNSFIKPDNTPFTYNGKYMNVWKIDDDKNLKIVSEIWGAVTAVDRTNFSFIGADELIEVPTPDINKNVEEEVNSRNMLIAKLVAARNGARHATDIYADDAIYLTYDTSMLIGMKNIKPYFIEHEKPGSVSIDSIKISASKMIDLGNYILEYDYYYVDVSWNNKTGRAIVTGKSTNVWRRNKKGQFMMYRQMVNHD